MHRIDEAVIFVLVLVFGPVLWAFSWAVLDILRTRRQARAHDRITRRYSSGDNGETMGKHSLRGETTNNGANTRTADRGRHALDDRDDVLAWEWPSNDPDEPGNDQAEAATKILPIDPWRDHDDSGTGGQTR
ncbi:MAG: hypothetical protein ACRDQ5_24140 [Sciscionella sp.]